MSSGLKPFTKSCRFYYKILIIMPGNLLTGPQKFAFHYITFFLFTLGCLLTAVYSRFSIENVVFNNIIFKENVDYIIFPLKIVCFKALHKSLPLTL